MADTVHRVTEVSGLSSESPQHSLLRSTGVREPAAFGGSVEDLVPPVVTEALCARGADSERRRIGPGAHGRPATPSMTSDKAPEEERVAMLENGACPCSKH